MVVIDSWVRGVCVVVSGITGSAVDGNSNDYSTLLLVLQNMHDLATDV